MRSSKSRVLAGLTSVAIGTVFVAASAIGALADSPSPATLDLVQTTNAQGQNVISASGSLFWGGKCPSGSKIAAAGIVWNDSGDPGYPVPGGGGMKAGDRSDGNLSHPSTGCANGVITFGPIIHTYVSPLPSEVCAVAYDVRAGQTSGAFHSIYEGDAPGQVGNTDNSILEPTKGGFTKVCKSVAAPPVLGLTKSANPASGSNVAPNDQIDYTLHYTNTGASDANGVTVTDAIPAGTTYKTGSAACQPPSGVTCTPSFAGNTVSYSLNLPAGKSGTATFSVTVNGNVQDRQVIDNVGQITFGGSSTPSNHTTHTVLIPAVKAPDVTITNVATPPSVTAGDLVTYHITVSNLNSASKATSHNQLLVDTLDPNVQFISVSSGFGWGNSCQYASGTHKVSCTYTPVLGIGAATSEVTIVAKTLTNGESRVDNTAHVDNGAGNPDDANPNNQTAQVSTPVGTPPGPPVIDVDKTATPKVDIGDPITYTVSVTNKANTPTNNTITVTDSLPNGVQFVSAGGTNWTCQGTQNLTCTWVGTALAGGASTTPLTIVGTALATAVPSVTNTAYAHMGNQTVNDSATTIVNPPVNLKLSKSADPASGSDVSRGQTIDYLLHYANTGSTAANNVTITDTVPDGTTYVAGSAACTTTCTPSVSGGVVSFTLDIAPGGSGDATFSVTVDSDDFDGQIIDNVARIIFNGTTTNSNHTKHIVFVPSGKLTLNKSVSPTKATIGTVLTYSLTAAASGDTDQTDVLVTDAIPDGTTFQAGSATCVAPNACSASYDSAAQVVTWSLGTLPAGTSATMGFQVKVNGADANGTVPTEIINIGQIKSNETPQKPSNRVVVPVTVVLGEKVVKTPTTPTTLPFTGFDAVQNALLALVLLGAGLVILTWPRLQPEYRREA